SIVVSVADTGPGISAENLKKLFQPFEQGDPDTTRKFGGTGLGLSICRNLAQLLGGDVTVRSEVGFGSTFTLRFPLKPAQEETPLKAENDPEKDVSLQGVCVLIVEDNHVNQMVVQRLLKGLGATFGTAENGQEAIDHLTKNKHRYDIILMDKQMPVMDGVEATRRLRSMDGDLASIPIIACTADVMTGAREQLLADGFTDFVEKPIRPGRLARAIAENIDRLGQEIPTDIPNTDDTYRVLAG
ncbi:MAG: response regulator, partial [Pseudomonadota bacterium]